MKPHARVLALAGLLSAVAAASLLGGCAPVNSDTLALLPPERAQELKVWSTNHSVVFDARFHSMDTCPFLTYVPAASTLRGQEWAGFAWKFYGAKHREENNCTCSADLARP